MIDFNKVIQYSRTMCTPQSQHLCATYVKRAFERGGCTYISGNGWNNQKWCKENGFVCIGEISQSELRSRGNNLRAHGNFSIWFPPNYKQQVGDVCLIKHGQYGHIAYAMGTGLNDWVSDFFQRPPGQRDGCGPYCYTSNYEGVQFWRHSSVLNDAPVVNPVTPSTNEYVNTSRTTYSSSAIGASSTPVTPTEISGMNDKNKRTQSGMVLGYHVRQK